MKQHLFQTTLLIAALLSGIMASAETGSLKVGTARVDISPPQDWFPIKPDMPPWPAGSMFADVHDPLFVRAVVIDNGVTKAALISFDGSGLLGSEDMVKAIIAEVGITPDHLMITATRTHNILKPPGNPAYFEIAKKGAVEAVRQANAHLQPARIGYGTGKAYINRNGRNPDGSSDKTVAVISFTNTAGEPIAVWYNYSMLPTTMFNVKTKNGQSEMTADLPGAVSTYVEGYFKNKVALWSSGAGGDLSLLFQAQYDRSPGAPDVGAAGWVIVDMQARLLGEEIVRIAKSAQNTTDKVTIWGEKKNVTCPGQKRADNLAPNMPGWFATTTAKMVDADPVNIPLSLLMFNDIALSGVSGEAYSEIGLHLKRDSIFDRTVFVTQTPGAQAPQPLGAGYIPSEAAYLNHTDSVTMANHFKPGCAESAIVKSFLDMMHDYLGTQRP